jgi:hypothetical protein
MSCLQPEEGEAYTHVNMSGLPPEEGEPYKHVNMSVSHQKRERHIHM